MRVRDVCRAAARYIEEHGWRRVVLEDSYGKVCLLGALMKVTGEDPSRLPSFQRPDNLDYTRAKEHLEKYVPSPNKSLWGFNDSQVYPGPVLRFLRWVANGAKGKFKPV